MSNGSRLPLYHRTTLLGLLQPIFTRDSKMLRVSQPWPGRPSVCHTAVWCQNGASMKSSPWAVARSLVYRDKISCPWVPGFPSNEGVKEGYPLKTQFCRYWLVQCENGCGQVQTCCLSQQALVTGLLDLSTSINLNDLETPKWVLVDFSQFFNAAHISTLNCDEMADDRPRQPAYEIFNIERRFQSCPSPTPQVQEGRRRQPSNTATPLKSGYFTAIISCSVKTVADRYRYVAYHKKQQ